MVWSRFFLDNRFLVLVIFVAFFLNLWGVPLFDLDEGAFSEATREMLLSGNYAATYLDGVPRYDKPILSYWFQALSVSALGLNEFALRLPSAIAATLWVWAAFVFAKAQWGRETAAVTVLIMANMLWIGLIGRAAIADAWLNLFISLSLFDIWRYWQGKRGLIVVRIYVWLALGMLTKGPVAVAIPLLTSGVFFVLQGQWREWMGAIFNPLGWLAFVAILCPWLVLVYQDQGMAFFQGFLIDHNLNRFSQTKEGHGGQWYYYLLVLPFVLLPFSGALYSVLSKIKTLYRDPLNLYLLLWFGVVFVLVSLSQTQLPHYVLYGVTGISLLFAHHRHTLMKGQWHLLFPLGFFCLMLAIPSVVDIAADKSHRLYEKQLLAQGQHVFGYGYYIAVVVAGVTCAVVALQKSAVVSDKLIAMGVVQTLFVFNVFIHVVADLQQRPVKEAALLSKQYQDKTILSFGIKMPSFSVYREKITPKGHPEDADILFTRADRIEELHQLLPNQQWHVLYQQGGIVLLEKEHDSDR